MLRDVSASVEVVGEPTVMASLVVEAESGLVLGVQIAADGREALRGALESASASPPPGAMTTRPSVVVCADGLGSSVHGVLESVMAPGAPPPVREQAPVAGAEDIFDSMLGHVGRRRLPEDFPEPEDWAAAFHAARDYREQAPWQRWSDTVHLRLSLERSAGSEGSGARYVCIVLGADGIQRGLAAVPGDELPAAFAAGVDHVHARPIPGTLMLLFDSPSELPPDLVAKARRYGWPEDDEVVPLLVSMRDDGPGEPSRRELHHLGAAAVAVAAHDRRGPVVVGAGTSTTTGTVTLSEGEATFSLEVAPRAAARRVADPPDGMHAARGTGFAARGPGDAAADAMHAADASIAELFDAFLDDQRARLAPRTMRKYETVIELLADCLNGYGHLNLDADERERFEAAYEGSAAAPGDEDAFVHLFGSEKIVDNLGEFLGYFMIRKVLAGEELLRSAGTVTKKLAVWLAEHGHLRVEEAAAAAVQGADAARDLPRAERLSRLLSEHAARSHISSEVLDSLAERDVVDDMLTIERVEPRALWFEGGIGPVMVPEAAADLAVPGWSLYALLARHRGRWHIVEAGSVYP